MNNVVMKKGLWGLGVLLMLGVSVAAYGFSRAGEQAESSAKVQCASTSGETCENRCPVAEGNSACCSSKVDASQSSDSCCKKQCCADTCELGAESKCELGAAGETCDAAKEGSACCTKKDAGCCSKE